MVRQLFDRVARALGLTRLSLGLAVSQHYVLEARDREGRLRWRDEFDNIVVTTGLNDILTQYWKGSSYTAAHYAGLKGTGSVVAGDTMASHSGWSEVTDYDEAARQTVTMGTASGGSIDNSANKATFTMSAAYTVAGAFVATNSTKGGSTGTLVGGGNFAASRSGDDGDTITLTVTSSLTSS